MATADLSLQLQQCERLLNASAAVKEVVNSSRKPTAAETWGIGLAFVTAISLCACGGILLIPLLSPKNYRRFLTFFVGLGVGSLSGGAIFHLLPEAFDLHERSVLWKCWVAVGGVYLFFLVDKFLTIIEQWKKNRKEKGKIHPSTTQNPFNLSSIGNGSLSNGISKNSGEFTNGGFTNGGFTNGGFTNGGFTNGLGAVDTVESNLAAHKHMEEQAEHQAHGMCHHDHSVEPGDSPIKTVAWMIIMGDGLHNFIDGLSVGAAFTSSVLAGVSVSIAILCEEFPHEMGDVAILLSSGMSVRQALLYNLLSACTCYLGFIIGVLLGELADAQIFIFALAGGMFLYISLASMVPEMNRTMEESLKKDIGAGLRVMALQCAGVATGLIIMFLLGYFEGEIEL